MRLSKMKLLALLILATALVNTAFAEEIACRDEINLRGKVIEAGGSSKLPGSDEEYRELQLLVQSFECLER